MKNFQREFGVAIAVAIAMGVLLIGVQFASAFGGGISNPASGSSSGTASTTLLGDSNTFTGQNTHTGLEIFTGNASTTLLSVSGNGTATTTIRTDATSTIATGISLTNGCFSVAGSCVQTLITQTADYRQAVNWATAGALASYTYTAGVITEVSTGALSVDGNSPAVGDRVLLKDESGSCTSSGGTCRNGIYTVTVAGSGIAAFVLTRATDFNQSSEVYPGVSVYVLGGNANANRTYSVTTAAPITLDTTGITFTLSSNGNITLPVSIANGGTAAAAFTTSGEGVYYTGSALATAPTISAIVIPFASTTSMTSSGPSWFGTTAGITGVGTTSPSAGIFTVQGGNSAHAGSIVNSEWAPATTTSITVQFASSTQQLLQIGTSATTITLDTSFHTINGQTLRLIVCNPNASAGAITWATNNSIPLMWAGAGAAPTQTTTAKACDAYSFLTTQATSTSSGAITIFGAGTTNF